MSIIGDINMTDLDIFNEMFNTDSNSCVSFGQNQNRLKLTEPQCASSSITLKGIPGNFFVLQMDRFDLPINFFSGNRGARKRANFVIIAEAIINKINKTVILYIELKNTNIKKDHVIKQLKGAFCFIQYCQAIGRSFWENKDFLKHAEHRFVVICKTDINKRPTFHKKAQFHNKPGNFLKVSFTQHESFYRLIGLK